jgi:hypothetical protein
MSHYFLNIWLIISKIPPLILLVGIFLNIKFHKKLKKIFLLIFIYLCISLIVDILFRYLGIYSHLKFNLFLIPIFGFAELIIYSIIYYKYLVKSRSKILLLLILLAHVLILLEIVFIKKSMTQKTFHSFGKVIADSVIILYCLSYYWNLFKGKIKIKQDIGLLIATTFIYYSVNLLIFLCVNFLVNANIVLVTSFWTINIISNSIFYTILTYLIWQNGKTQSISR